MTSKTQRLEMSLSLFKINIDTKSSEPHFCGNMLQLRVSSGPKGGTFPVPIGKTEIKKILASKPAKVVLEFGSKISLDCFDPDAQVRVQLLVDDSVFGTTVIEQKALEDACVSGKSVRKKFRNPEEKIVDSPFVEVKVEAYAALTNAPVIEISELKFVRIIGKGAFGEVWEGDCRASKVAIKKIINTRNDHTALDEFMDEMLLMRDNPHPNLVLLIGVCHDRTKGDIYCVTELLQGDVHQLLIDPATKKAFSLASIINMAADAASGIAWLHNRTPPILHRDIKPSNFLHNEFNRIKVGDFGLSREITTTNQTDFLTIAGSPIYMAPEAVMVGGPAVSVKSDVYSFAISLWEMLSQTPVFLEYTTGVVPNPREHWEQNVIRGSYRPQCAPSWPESLQQLLAEMWAPNPQDRPDMPTIVDRLQKMKNECIRVDELLEYKQSIVDPVGIEFWMAHFPGESFVSFTRFYRYFLPFLGFPIPKDRAIQQLSENATPSQLAAATVDQLDNLVLRFPDRKDSVAHYLRDVDRSQMPAASSTGPALNFKSDQERVLASLARYLCDDDPTRTVKSHAFGQFLEYFGPLDPRNLQKIMVNFQELVRRPYFFGTPPKARAQLILSTAIQSYQPTPNFDLFLIRTSNSSKGGFTLEYGHSKEKKIIRVAINRLPDGRFYAGDTTSSSSFTSYPTIDDFLRAYFGKRIPNPVLHVQTRHCPNSPFLSYWLTPFIMNGGEAYSQVISGAAAYSTPDPPVIGFYGSDPDGSYSF